MSCIKCGDENVLTFFSEEFSCTECNHPNEILYKVCRECGNVWKALGDQIVVEASDVDMKEMFGPEFEEFLDMLDEQPKSMQETIHKCLKCGKIAFEVEPDHYRCPSCDFEWEVM